MNEIARIKDQVERAFKGDAWHGPSVLNALRDVTAERAHKKPLKGVHSIWEIVLHIAAWHQAVTQRLEGYVVSLTREEDWPPVEDRDESTWRSALELLNESYENLLKKVSSLPDSDLDKTAPGRNHSVYVMLHGIIQHDLYHAGQIAILKKG
jgi:uncharacterized damage-inducible protein DinB